MACGCAMGAVGVVDGSAACSVVAKACGCFLALVRPPTFEHPDHHFSSVSREFRDAHFPTFRGHFFELVGWIYFGETK